MHKHQIALLELSKLGLNLSRRELAKRLGIASMSTVCHHINELEKQGYVLNFEKQNYADKKYAKRLEITRELNEVIKYNKDDLASGNLDENGINYAKGVIDCCEHILSLFGVKE